MAAKRRAGVLGAAALGAAASLVAAVPATASDHADDCAYVPFADGAQAEILGAELPALRSYYPDGHRYGQRRANPRIIVVAPTGDDDCVERSVTDVSVARLRRDGLGHGAVEPPAVDVVKGVDLRGYSLGGNVRATPGIEGARVGALLAGEPVRITLNTGVWMDGYYWFRVEQARVPLGYQWGGLLCGRDEDVRGMRACHD